MLALFATVSSSMIVVNALPAITGGLGLSADDGLWVVLASLVSMTVATPVWGKLADHLDKKRLTQVAIVIFVVASIGAGFAPGAEVLIAMRALQGIATGGLLAMAQAVLGVITTPRERGAYSGYLGAVMSIATLCGPLLGGLVVDAPGLGWRWCFFLVVPLAVVGGVVVQVTLRVPRGSGRVSIDAAGVALLAVAILALVSWLTFAGSRFGWISPPSAALLALVLGGTVVFVLVERRVREPLVSPALLRHRATAWAAVGSVGIGIVMFSSILFLSQYLQLARDHPASVAGALAAPMLLATLLGSVGSGHLVARTGRLRGVLVAGAVLLVAGFAGLAAITPVTPDGFVVAATLPVGLGTGMLMQNFVLVAQNAVDATWVGRVSALLSLLRSLAGAIGVAALGAVALAAAGPHPDAASHAAATATVYLICCGASVVVLVAAIAVGPQTLRGTIRR